MEITLGPDLEAALTYMAKLHGITPEELALNVLRERFLRAPVRARPPEEVMRILSELAKPCGVSLPDSALSSDELYD